LHKEKLLKELLFKGIRSSGSGGQHVNKVSSKIELTYNLENSNSISEKERALLYTRWSTRLTKENNLILHCDESRSQHRNKELAIKRFLTLLQNAIKVDKIRKATKPSRSSVLKRLENKKTKSLKKTHRKKQNWD